VDIISPPSAGEPLYPLSGLIDAIAAAPFRYDEAGPQAITKVAAPLRAVAPVNMTHMQDADARQDEFAALDRPVLQVGADRTNDVAGWRADPSGIPTQTAAMALSVPDGWGSWQQ